ncbi:Rik1-associated factor 1 [Penicillium rolfsii]|nr:Rik1-associated factor 1 [Penicillium rolfsii]
MSHHSIYFTRGIPRSTVPAFTGDSKQIAHLEALAEQLYQQYTYGLAQPSNGRRDSGSFVTHGHTKFAKTNLGWVPHDDVVDEVALVTPTFMKPKPTDLLLSKALTSSPAPSTTVKSAPPRETPAPPAVNASVSAQGTSTPPIVTVPSQETRSVNSTAPTQGISTPTTTRALHAAPSPVDSISPALKSLPRVDIPRTTQETLATVTVTKTPQDTHQAPRISGERPTKSAVPTPARKEDLRRSVTLLNASRNQSVKTQPATHITTQPQEVTETTISIKIPDLQASMSSSECRPSSSSSQSSRSPTPQPPSQVASPSTRRSRRARVDPVTYNLKKLSRIHDSPSQSEREDSPVVSRSPPPAASPRSLPQVRQPSQPRQSSQGRPALQDFPAKIQEPPDPKENPKFMKPKLTSILWNRELHGAKPSHDLVRSLVSSNLKPWKTWKGASGDVSALAWSPDGAKFVTGASAKSDEYNRRNTLLFGDISQNTLHELPDHNIPQTINATTADDLQFPTVSTVKWVHRQLYTGSYDHTVKVWNTDPISSPVTPTCLATLGHDSSVRVMDVSESMPHLVATGTENSFILWNLLDRTLNPQPLQIHRDPRQKANVVLEPTVLGWGQNEATKHYLVGGMTEAVTSEFKVPLCGHLAMWRVAESSIEPRRVKPDSQNIFDLKWHPTMPKFAIGSTYSQSMNLPLRSKSVVQLFDIESDGRAVLVGKCACSAMDMNEITFCPMDSTFVTASCTDGSTYVWDSRFDSKPIHKLSHGPSVIPLPSGYSREVTDFGVKMALWGTTMDQFYTGGSDGVLKQWDIRRATEDALVANVANLGDGITSGAFSPDKSQLLLGTNGGAVHVLSCEHSEEKAVDFEFKHAPEPPSEEERGVPIAQEFLSSGQLILHPVFGPVQGPKYNGPYAPWARGLPKTVTKEKLKQTPLLSEYQLRQFDGPSPIDRHGLDPVSRREVQSQFNLARARHARRGGSEAALISGDNALKRKRDSLVEFGGIDKNSQARKKKKKKDKLRKHHKHSHVITRIEESIIDLTMDSDSDMVTTESVDTRVTAPMAVAADTGKLTIDASVEPLEESLDRQLSLSPMLKVLDEESDGEEDYWWPDSRLVDANLAGSGDL